MNTIIIDFDCRQQFPSDKSIVELLKDTQCEVLYLDSESLPQIDQNRRGVLITSMNSGFQKYHRDLIVNNPSVRSWIISIIGISFKGEQDQLVDNIGSALYDSKVAYNIIFDDCSTLQKTSEICAIPISEKKTCLIVSNNSDIANKCVEYLSLYLSTWYVIFANQNAEQLYQSADVIIAVGEKEEDFNLPAPKSSMGRIYGWTSNSGYENEQLCSMAYDALTESGWNLGTIKNVYSGSLEMEKYYHGLYCGELSDLQICNDENFVIWDRYGLPLKSKDYSIDTIKDFLNRQCCFSRLIKSFE